ncbi:Uncharacterised protein [Mycobacteroides abscessus]|nr:Uncharacterised protein [Mycobacteroides abscessus]
MVVRCVTSNAPRPCLRGALGGDQVVEPLHFSFTGFQSKLVQLLGVPIERAACPGDGLAQTLPALLYLPAAAFEDPHPGLGRRAVEERQVHAEAVVGVVLWPGVRHQLAEPGRPAVVSW